MRTSVSNLFYTRWGQALSALHRLLTHACWGWGWCNYSVSVSVSQWQSYSLGFRYQGALRTMRFGYSVKALQFFLFKILDFYHFTLKKSLLKIKKGISLNQLKHNRFGFLLEFSCQWQSPTLIKSSERSKNDNCKLNNNNVHCSPCAQRYCMHAYVRPYMGNNISNTKNVQRLLFW